LNITPYLPSQYPLVNGSDRTVSPVRPTGRARDALQQDDRPQATRQPMPTVDVETVAGRADALARPHDPTVSYRANRALSSYTQVAGQDDRSDLQSLLGFDEYA
jgi:hypothetical protein